LQVKKVQQNLKNRAALPAAAAATTDKKAAKKREKRSVLAAEQLTTAATRQAVALERQAQAAEDSLKVRRHIMKILSSFQKNHAAIINRISRLLAIIWLILLLIFRRFECYNSARGG
jgi:uncharacterized membrane protein